MITRRRARYVEITIVMTENERGEFFAHAELGSDLLDCGPWATRLACLDGIGQHINEYLERAQAREDTQVEA